MKHPVFITIFAALLMLGACQNKNAEKDDANEQRIDSLMLANRQKDAEINDMLATFNEIQEGLRIITEAENKVTLLKDDENANNTEQIKKYMQVISEQMRLNRELVAKLRNQLRESTVEGEQLKKTIDTLTEELARKEEELQGLRAELEQKNIQIAELGETVSTLETNVSNLTQENTSKAQTISSQDKALNTAWYVFGTKKELKDQHIISDNQVLRSSFNQNYFTKIDIRVDKEIKLYSKSAKVLTAHPADSYTLLQDANKQYILRIKDADKFWSTSKYLVVLVK
ncbi:MAG: hypothetical protein LUC49_06315 [Prevotella sp.]|nr:hypothetical protein [Prevotella sp.]MCD8306252.1 hypothetical protein [Prevotella sp.]